MCSCCFLFSLIKALLLHFWSGTIICENKQLSGTLKFASKAANLMNIILPVDFSIKLDKRQHGEKQNDKMTFTNRELTKSSEEEKKKLRQALTEHLN